MKNYYNESSGYWEPVVEDWMDCSIKKGPNKGFYACSREYLVHAIGADDGELQITKNGQTGNVLLLDFLNGKPRDPWIEGNTLKYDTGFSDVELWYQYMANTVREIVYIPHVIPVTFNDYFNITFRKSANLQFTDPTMCDATYNCVYPQVFKEGDTTIFQIDGLWLNNAIYPVEIDPILLLDHSSVSLDSVTYTERNPVTPGSDVLNYTISNYPSVDMAVILVGRNKPATNDVVIGRIGMDWDTSSIPYWAHVTNITLSINYRILGTQGNSNLTVVKMSNPKANYGTTNQTGYYDKSANEADCTKTTYGQPTSTFLNLCRYFHDLGNGTAINWSTWTGSVSNDMNITMMKDQFLSNKEERNNQGFAIGLFTNQGEDGTGTQSTGAIWGPSAAVATRRPRLSIVWEECKPNGVTDFVVNKSCIIRDPFTNPFNTTIFDPAGQLHISALGSLDHTNNTWNISIKRESGKAIKISSGGVIT